MSEDRTQYQTAGGESASQKLSMRATTPPAEVPGYRLQRFIGSGAFGQVWVGRDLNTGRGVAVKFYLHRGGVNWSLLSREVKNLVLLSADRHVVQVLEVGWDADPPYYVMELVGGGSLEDLLQTRERLPVAEAVEMFRKICMGLNHCHGKGVLHCDLKPANILLGQDNEPRLADFGQSRMSDDQRPALGTLFYMAPEQADLNSTPDAGWDVYAAGAILFRMLTGKPPYRNDTIVEQLDTAGSLPKRLERYRQAIDGSPPPDQHLQRRDVDRALARIVSRCLAPDPDDRYANAQQILQDLNRRDTARSRRPLMLLGIVGPLLILMATCVYGVRSIRRASESTKSALRQEAFGSNQAAATAAAWALESEVDRYFRLARDEAANLVQPLTTALEDQQVKDTLAEISSLQIPAKTQDTGARDRLLDIPARLQLTDRLNQRLALYKDSPPNSRKLRLASMFVTDAQGTIISIAYNEPVERADNSAGRNFCYRTYFHGGRQELAKTDPLIGQVNPATSIHLSAAFQSTATGLWKVAVSTPIFLDDQHTEPNALFVVTINLGDFRLPQNKEGGAAVLVQAREGSDRGTILQHPLMDARRSVGQTLANEKYQLPPELFDRLAAGGDVNYLDPMAGAEDGTAYEGDWLAAMQTVSVPYESDAGGQGETTNTDLLVLVQFRLDKVMEPVNQMRTALLWEGAAALLSILCVTLTLWFFVRRVGDVRTVKREPETPHSGTTETIAVN